MDASLARSLDISGLRAVLPALTGDPALVAVAEVLRCAVLASAIVGVAGVVTARWTSGDQAAALAAYKRHLPGVFEAPTDAAWWVEHTPVSIGDLTRLQGLRGHHGPSK